MFEGTISPGAFMRTAVLVKLNKVLYIIFKPYILKQLMYAGVKSWLQLWS